MPDGRVSRMGQEIRAKADQRVFKRAPSIGADPDAICCGREDVVRMSGHTMDPADRVGLRQLKTEAGGLPGLSPIRGLHEANPVSTSKVCIACGNAEMAWVVGMKGHIGHSHASPVGCTEQGPVVA